MAAAGAHVYVENGRRTYAPLLSETTTLLSETHTPALSHVGCSPTDGVQTRDHCPDDAR